MEAIVKQPTQEELAAVYLEAHETVKQIEETNHTLDALDPLLDRLKREIQLNGIKSSRIRAKMYDIAAKL